MPELEIITGPLEVYWGPVGEAYPAVSAAPAGNWVLVGASGSKNYHEDGVHVRYEKTTDVFRSLGSPFPRKAFISEADYFVDLTLVDMTLAFHRLAMNQNAVTSDAGFDYLSMDIGATVSEIALLVRGEGNSPLFDGSNMQYEFDKVVEVAGRDLGFVKNEPVGVELSWQIIYNDGATYPVGRLVEADA